MNRSGGYIKTTDAQIRILPIAIGETDPKLVDMLVNMLVYMLLSNATQCMLVYVLAWKH